MVARHLAALLVFMCAPGFCQSDDLTIGKFLVASRDLGDPNFAKTVILLVHYSVERGAVGLVINRRTDVPVSRVFQDLKEAKGRMDPVYVGGPVELNTVLALLMTPSKPTIAERVFGDVFLVSDKDALKATLASSVESNAFHVYVGYAGWGAKQLEHEVELGAWHIMRPDSATVFNDDPDSVWERMIRRTETQIARTTYTPLLPSPAHR